MLREKKAKGFSTVAMENEEESKPDTKEEHFSKLPHDIIFDIFTRLPLKTIANCKYVSKQWYAYIHHPRFAEIHHSKTKGALPLAVFLHRYLHSFLVDPECIGNHDTSVTAYDLQLNEFSKNFTISNGWNCFEVVGTVNGLICFSPEKGAYEPAPYYICNPLTRDYVMPPMSPKMGIEPMGSGFGFDSVNNEYKIVRILIKKCKDWSDSENDDCGNGSEVEIYTLGSGIWREIPSYVPHIAGMRSSNVFLHGCLHWAAYVLIESEHCQVILSFNTTTEQFNVIEMPSIGDKLGDLVVLGECLCVMFGRFFDGKEIWVMKQYGAHSSWVLEYVFEQEIFHSLWHGCHEVVELKNGNLLLLNRNRVLGYYDCKNKGFQAISLQNLDGNTLHVKEPFFQIYLMGSLLSPKDIEKR